MTLRADSAAPDRHRPPAGPAETLPEAKGLGRLWLTLHSERLRGRAYQPRFSRHHLAFSRLGALLSLGLLGALSAWSGHPRSPLAQPRNIVLGNGLAALIAVLVVSCGWHGAWAVALAVGLTIVVGQRCRCLHPPAGGVAFLGVFLKADPGFLLFPVPSGSLLLVLLAWQFSRGVRSADAYPVHWL